MNAPNPPLGIIAGSGSLPLTFARLAKNTDARRLIAVAFEGETDPALASLVDDVTWLRVGQLARMIDALRQAGVKQCVMLGQIAPRRLFDLRPDFRALALMLKLKERNAQTLFGAIAAELAKDGVELIEATPWLRPIMPGAGYAVGPRLNAQQSEDVSFAWRMAKEVSRLEIGQLVVVRKGTVLAVEGFEGTDACLRRGGELAGKGGGAVAAKVASEHHDFRFDVPCIGPKTIETCLACGVAVLAIESDKTLLLERGEVEALSRRQRLSLVTFP